MCTESGSGWEARAYEYFRLNYFDASTRSLNCTLEQSSLPMTSWFPVQYAAVFTDEESRKAMKCSKYSSNLNSYRTQTTHAWFTGITEWKLLSQIHTEDQAYLNMED